MSFPPLSSMIELGCWNQLSCKLKIQALYCEMRTCNNKKGNPEEGFEVCFVVDLLERLRRKGSLVFS